MRKLLLGLILAILPLTASADGAGGGAGGIKGNGSYYAMAGYYSTSSANTITFGGGQFNSSSYGTVQFQISGIVTNAAATCTVTLYDITNSASKSALTLTTTANATTTSGGLSLAAANTQYEIRVSVTGGYTCTVFFAGLIFS